jgi:hemerythrin-like domain-containing protein
MATNPLSDQATPGFDDPLGLLAACHRRIERQLATLARLQRHLPENGCDAGARAAARAILRYFDTAAPNHHTDEEQSLFPRVAALTQQADALLGELEREHARLADNWRKLRPLLASIAAGRRATLPPRQVIDVAGTYRAHIAKEESRLLPLAERIFDAPALKAIGDEMAARRGVES